MSREFKTADFEPLYDQTLVLVSSLAATTSDLSILLPDLNSIHTHLSTLIEKADNPKSLLRKRCSDRHGEWLQITYDLQNTLCETQDLIDTLIEEDGDGRKEIDFDRDYARLVKAQDELGTHAFNIGEFIDSLGLSKLARKEPALSEIERILVEAAREERELYQGDIGDVPEVNRLGGRGGIRGLLRKNGVDQKEIARLDTRIKELVCWVFRIEPELTLVRDLEGFGDEGKQVQGGGASRVPEWVADVRKGEGCENLEWNYKAGEWREGGTAAAPAVPAQPESKVVDRGRELSFEEMQEVMKKLDVAAKGKGKEAQKDDRGDSPSYEEAERTTKKNGEGDHANAKGNGKQSEPFLPAAVQAKGDDDEPEDYVWV